MKKFITLFLSLFVVIAGFAQTPTVSIVVPSGSYSNLLGISQSGSSVITSVSVTALTAEAATIRLYDSVDGQWTNVFPATTSISTKGTNWIQCWTNYYGVQNCWTNISTILVTNAVPSTTNLAPVRAIVSVAASGTTTVSPVSYMFEHGVWATNNSGGPVGVTITYRQ